MLFVKRREGKEEETGRAEGGWGVLDLGGGLFFSIGEGKKKGGPSMRSPV